MRPVMVSMTFGLTIPACFSSSNLVNSFFCSSASGLGGSSADACWSLEYTEEKGRAIDGIHLVGADNTWCRNTGLVMVLEDEAAK